MTHKILLVEDDPSFGSVLKSYLELSEYSVVHCINGAEGLETFKKEHFDLCLFDVMMPVMDGFTLAENVRKINKKVPLIFITAKSMKEDMVHGFEIGADDYITKPFDSEVLFLKIKALLNRVDNDDNIVNDIKVDTVIYIGNTEYNTDFRALKVGEKNFKLTPKEAALLILLYKHKDHLLPRELALKEIWGSTDYFTARSMDVYITKLRKYFKEGAGLTIENIHGSGFRLVEESK
ncbi:MAG: response regulator transcription factor [Marinifilaceae bacterium]